MFWPSEVASYDLWKKSHETNHWFITHWLINHWFPLIRPYETLLSEGYSNGEGGRLTSHDCWLKKSCASFCPMIFVLHAPGSARDRYEQNRLLTLTGSIIAPEKTHKNSHLSNLQPPIFRCYR